MLKWMEENVEVLTLILKHRRRVSANVGTGCNVRRDERDVGSRRVG